MRRSLGLETGRTNFPYLAHAGSVVLGEAILDFVDCWGDLCELLAVYLLGLGAHAGDGQNLSVLDDALLQLAEQNPKACRVSVEGVA